MPTSLYNFQYVPLTGRLPGKSFVSQTEQAINGLAQYVYDNSTNYEAVKAIAQKAEEDSSSALEYSEQALDKAQTALETVGRAYIKTTSAVDLNDYYDSELLLILSTASTNLPASISGYLTVMSSDTHDYCMQVYIGIDGSVYKRTATISDNTPTFGAWSETPITLSSLQTILANYTTVDASNIGVNAQIDNSTAWGNAIGGGEIASGEQRLITGGTVYPLSQNVAQNTSNIATNTADIVQNTGGISANSKRITNIEKLLQGNLYDYQTDSASAYTKSVPAGAMPYAGLEKVGGKTVVMNQTAPAVNSTNWQGWSSSYVTVTFSDETLIADVIDDAAGGYYMSGIYAKIGHRPSTKAGHKYFTSFDIMSSSNAIAYQTQIISLTNHTITSANTWQRIATLETASSDNNPALVITPIGYVADLQYKIKNVIFIDLTLMFGSGNEPTIEEFESMFPADYYEYDPGSLLSAGVTSVVSKDSNDTTLQTVSIPAEVQALEGYGWSAGSVYNYVDFERKVFVKNVEKIVLNGDDSQTIYSVNWRATETTTAWIYSLPVTPNIKKPANVSSYTNLITAKYQTINYGQAYTGDIAGISVDTGATLGILIRSSDTSLTTLTAINNYLSNNPITVYYELATPVETDISQYLTDDNLIQVEAGGTLTFPNSNGDDYQIPVPSEETYMIDLQEAINNG